jgi:hypothetical protein
MPTPFSGSCSCGAIRYTCSAEPYVSYCCHCTACQKRTASAFGISLQVPSAGLTVDQGTPKTRVRIADSGNERVQHFCGDCGSSLFGTSEATKKITVIYAGTLDDPSWMPVMANIWTDSALPWVAMSSDVERYGKAPDFSKYYAARDD